MKKIVVRSAPDVKGCRLILRGSRDRNMRILQSVGYGCAALLAASSALSGETTWTLIAAALFLTIGVFISVSYNRAAKVIFAGIQDKSEIEFTFDKSGIKAGVRSYAYSDIARVWENRTHLAFQLKKGGVFAVRKPENAAELRAFLMEKMGRKIERILL